MYKYYFEFRAEGQRINIRKKSFYKIGILFCAFAITEKIHTQCPFFKNMILKGYLSYGL